MRILTLSREPYPAKFWTSYVLFHQSMALEELGHEVHLFNLGRPSLPLLDYLDAYEFDLLYVDLALLEGGQLWRTLRQHRRGEALHVVGALYSLPAPPDSSIWEVVDFAVTPWKGKSIQTLAKTQDIRYLPLGYNARLHRRSAVPPAVGSVFVGNTAGNRQHAAASYLDRLRQEHVLLCIGPDFDHRYVDPFLLGRVYAAARCAPNFHYPEAKGDDRMLNERFWQSARCSVPVNDYSPLMEEVWNKSLVENFCFADKREWQERVRRLNSATVTIAPALLDKLDRSMAGHSYHDRMKQLLDWLA